MAWRGALSRSLMPTSRAYAFRTLTPCSAPPRLHSASVSSSCSRLPFIDTALRPSQPPSSFRFLFSNSSTLGQLGCIPSPLHSMVAGARMTSHYAIKMSDKRNISDHKRRLLAARYELRRRLYKALCKDPNLPNVMREKVRYKLSKLPRKSSFTRVRNRCIYSGRPRGVYRLFRMSRLVFRGLANHGQLMGVKKASW